MQKLYETVADAAGVTAIIAIGVIALGVGMAAVYVFQSKIHYSRGAWYI